MEGEIFNMRNKSLMQEILYIINQKIKNILIIIHNL